MPYGKMAAPRCFRTRRGKRPVPHRPGGEEPHTVKAAVEGLGGPARVSSGRGGARAPYDNMAALRVPQAETLQLPAQSRACGRRGKERGGNHASF